MDMSRWLPLVVLSAGVALAAMLLTSADGLGRLKALRAEYRRYQAESLRLELEVERLRGKADAIKRDPEAVERVARERLGLIRPSEVVVQFTR
jgi:cell division protein FtsB